MRGRCRQALTLRRPSGLAGSLAGVVTLDTSHSSTNPSAAKNVYSAPVQLLGLSGVRDTTGLLTQHGGGALSSCSAGPVLPYTDLPGGVYM